MKAGRELDMLIAEKVMGLDPKWFNQSTSYYEAASEGPRLKPYSTDIAAAWEVVEKIRPDFGELWIGRSDTEVTNHWQCSLQHAHVTYEATANTAPHAICLAALKSVSEER